MSDAELAAIDRRVPAATTGPWRSFVEGRDHTSGDSFLRIGEPNDGEPDMYLSRETAPASSDDVDFVAHARQDIPRLLAEVRRLRADPGSRATP